MAREPSERTSIHSGWTRRGFVAASGIAAVAGNLSRTLAGAETDSALGNHVEAVDFPSSYLYCAPTNSGIWVRVQMECRGCLTNLATGETNEYVMGVMAKTGLSPDPRTGKLAPGYDYTIIFSKTHIFTKRSHSSAYLDNPTVLERKDFGDADRRFKRARAEPLRSAAEIRMALEKWRRITAKTVFTSADGDRQFTLEYPVKWADYSVKIAGFRVETGPVFLLNPDKLRAGTVPKFEDFQWAHLDYKSFDSVRCLMEQPTSILADATFMPPAEDGREIRQTPQLTEPAVKEIEDSLYTKDRASLPRKTIESLLSTDHYSRVANFVVKNELYALAD
jgi:hypothetical protein